MADDQTPPDTARKRDRIEVLNRDWLLDHGGWYLVSLIAVLAVYSIIIHSFQGGTRLSDTVGAMGVLASVITLIVVMFQIDVALRIAQTQTQIAGRELEILARQDEEMRRLPDLRLLFTDGQGDRTHNSIGTRLEYARSETPMALLFSIQNRGKSLTGVSVELWLPAEMRIAGNVEQQYDWRQSPIYLNTADPGPYFFGNRTDLDTLRLAEGAPVDLAPIYFVIKFAEVPSDTPSSDLPAPLTIRYRLKAEGMTWPTDTAFGELRLLAITSYDPANPQVEFPPKPFSN